MSHDYIKVQHFILFCIHFIVHFEIIVNKMEDFNLTQIIGIILSQQ